MGVDRIGPGRHTAVVTRLPQYLSDQPNSPAEWLSLARQYERSANLCVRDKVAAARAWNDAGFAVEAALKAVVMHRQRLNCWPSKDSRPDLHIHDLRKLAVAAGIVVGPSDPIAPAWRTVVDWNRGHSYTHKRMPRKVAQSMVEAAFGTGGVLPWLISNFLRNP